MCQAQRRRIALQLAQEERSKAQVEERRLRVLQDLEDEEDRLQAQNRVRHAEIEAKRKVKLQEEEERRRTDPELASRAKRLQDYVATSAMRNLSTIKRTQHMEALSFAQEAQEAAGAAEGREEQENPRALYKDEAERVQFGDEIAEALARAKKHLP